jgi:hypothetical protein
MGMRRNRLFLLFGVIGVAALVVAYVLLPVIKGQPVVLAAVLGAAGLVAVLAAVAASLPAQTRSLIGWSFFGIAPIGLVAWVFGVGIPAGAGAVVVGAVVCAMAVAGLVLAVRAVSA